MDKKTQTLTSAKGIITELPYAIMRTKLAEWTSEGILHFFFSLYCTVFRIFLSFHSTPSFLHFLHLNYTLYTLHPLLRTFEEIDKAAGFQQKKQPQGLKDDTLYYQIVYRKKAKRRCDSRKIN